MNKKLWVGFIVVFITMSILAYLIHGVLLNSIYQSDELKNVWRPDMMSMMWIYHVIYLIQSFIFSLIFSKGYEGKGIGEGVRYGFYMGLLLATPMAYASYASYPLPYSLALQWFIYGMLEYIILGVVIALVYGKKPAAAPAS